MAQGGSEGRGRYVAFISYSHRDAAIGRWLHRRLETYRIPKRLVGDEGEHGPVPARLTPIFRDRDELPAAGDLSEKVRSALASSDNLIVVCSPNSAASLWVAKEISTFRELHPGRPIFTAIVEGDPSQCFPPALREGGIEPLAADLRKEGDGRRLGVLKLVAGLSGIGLDALVQRDAQRHLRRVTMVTLGAVAAMLIMAVLTILALSARAEAERQRAEAEGLVEFMLTDLRDRLKGVGRLDVLTAVNERALQHYQGQDLEGLPPESLERRARILHAMGEDDERRGDLNRAVIQFEEAARTTAALVAADPDNPDRIFAHLQSEYWVASVAEQRGDFETALAAYRRYRDVAERLYRRSPANPKYVGELAYSESNLGIVSLNGFNRPDVARRHFAGALRWFEHAARMQPDKLDWQAEAADAHAWIADSWFAEKRYPEARAARLEERRIKQALIRREPQNRVYLFRAAVTARSLARIDMEMQAYSRAEKELAQARATLATLLDMDPDNLVWRDQATRVEADMAKLLLSSGKAAAAAEPLRRAQRLMAEGDRKGATDSASRRELRNRIAGMLAGQTSQSH